VGAGAGACCSAAPPPAPWPPPASVSSKKHKRHTKKSLRHGHGHGHGGGLDAISPCLLNSLPLSDLSSNNAVKWPEVVYSWLRKDREEKREVHYYRWAY